MNDAIHIEDVTYTIRKGFWLKKSKLLQKVTLNIKPQEAVAVVGPNGAGKTTLFKIAAGLIRPDSGKALLSGSQASCPRAKEELAFLTENQYIYPHLSIAEWLNVMGRCLGLPKKMRQKRVYALMEEYALLPHAKKPLKELSKGLRQRTMLAQLFLNQPRTLILDEPMSGLDHLWREKLREHLNRFRAQGGTLLFSTHILPDVEALCDRVVYLDGGRIKWDGPIDHVLNQGRQMHVVLKKGKIPPATPFENTLWERSGQQACLLSPEAMEKLQQELASGSDWRILRAAPHIPSLEAMFHHA